MTRISKEKLQTLTNAELANNGNLSVGEVSKAFANYNRLISFVARDSTDPARRRQILLERTDAADAPALSDDTIDALLELGTLNAGLAELAVAPGVGMRTLLNLVPPLLALELTDDPEPVSVNTPIQRRKPRGPLVRLDSVESLRFLASLGGALTTPQTFAAMPLAISGVVDKLSSDLDKLKQMGEEGKKIAETVKDAIDAFKKAGKLGAEATGTQTPAELPKSGGTAVVGGSPMITQVDGIISDDQYGAFFGEALDNEPLFSVWVDRILAYEVDGVGDDDLFWTAQTTTFLQNPRKIIRSNLVSSIYQLDERQESRLPPLAPNSGKRKFPLSKNDWKLRRFIDEKDAFLALRVEGDKRGIPLTRLAKIDIEFRVYESDAVDEFNDSVASLASATVATFRFIEGSFAAPTGSLDTLTDAVRTALKNLNTLINSEDLVFGSSFRFTAGDFMQAFSTGQKFAVANRKGLAAVGLPSQRIIGGYLDDEKTPVDQGSADGFLKIGLGLSDIPEFLEDTFERLIEVQLRFEKVPARVPAQPQ